MQKETKSSTYWFCS